MKHRERICARCRHFVDDPLQLERRLPGFTILSSAFGDTCDGQGLCELHGRFLHPRLSCDRFEPADLSRPAARVDPAAP